MLERSFAVLPLEPNWHPFTRLKRQPPHAHATSFSGLTVVVGDHCRVLFQLERALLVQISHAYLQKQVTHMKCKKTPGQVQAQLEHPPPAGIGNGANGRKENGHIASTLSVLVAPTWAFLTPESVPHKRSYGMLSLLVQDWSSRAIAVDAAETAKVDL